MTVSVGSVKKACSSREDAYELVGGDEDGYSTEQLRDDIHDRLSHGSGFVQYAAPIDFRAR